MGEIAVMSSKGDTKTIWSKDSAEEVEVARQTFDTFRRKGYHAFKVEGKEGSKGERTDTFDPDAERIIFVKPMVGGGGS